VPERCGAGRTPAAVVAAGRRAAVRALAALAIALGGLVTWTVAGGGAPVDAQGGAPKLAPLDTMPVPTPP
jgi:hypothetical protein